MNPASDWVCDVACTAFLEGGGSSSPSWIIFRRSFLTRYTQFSIQVAHFSTIIWITFHLTNTSCALLAAIEPLTGNRLAEVYPTRTMKEYTLFCQALVKRWPDAEKIRLVQDNLNTYTSAAFYQHLPADEAFTLAQKFEFIYTPKSASWLNVIEIEFSAIARQCLHRRIPTIERLAREVLAIVQERDAWRIKITWQFSISVARDKMNSHYQRVHPENSKLKKTYFTEYLVLCKISFCGFLLVKNIRKLILQNS